MEVPLNAEIPAHSAPDPFVGPFQFDPGAAFEANPRLFQALQQRRRRLGRWARASRWYVDGLLQPNAGERGVHVAPLSRRELGKPLLCAYLDRPLGEIVAAAQPDHLAVMRGIDAAVEYWVEIVLDLEDGRGVCRQATIRPAAEAGHISWLPRLPFTELIRHVVGFVEEVDPAPRPRSLANVAKEFATVYLAARDRSTFGANREVAEHFGWRTPDDDGHPMPWRDDARARSKVRRARDAAVALGHLS